MYALDLETRGTRWHYPGENEIIGVGLASEESLVYFAYNEMTTQDKQKLLEWLKDSENKFIAHNALFDAGFLYSESNYFYNFIACTYAMYKHLASEGYPNQSWGLKSAQTELLGWDESNEKELDLWLINNGYEGSVSKTYKQDSYYIKEKERWVKPKKAEMWRAPKDILGYYCALDSYSTLHLYKLMMQVINDNVWGKNYLSYLFDFMVLINELIHQQMNGVSVDTQALTEYYNKLDQELIPSALDKFYLNDKVSEAVKEFNEIKLNELLESKPEQYKKPKPLGKQPPEFTKSGEVSKNYLKYIKRKQELEQTGPELSLNYVKWLERYNQAKLENQFNPNSGQQLSWLFYDKLNYKKILFTESGQPATDKKALLGFGEPGLLLKTYNDLVKEKSYIEAGLEHSAKDNRIHFQFRAPGTLTGRLAGTGGINGQQLPKSLGYLSCLRPEPGRAWVDYDINSLEQVVLTELSLDPTLIKLYGPDAKPGQDVYLFNGANLPIIGEKIRKAGYDPDNFTPEIVNHVKKICKKERSISKVITLASSYGAGPGKLHETLSLSGVDITLEQVKQLHSAYWDLYKGVKLYEQYLNEEWSRNKGYVLNGVGRPIPVSADLRKDLVNRVCQSTGHDILVMLIRVMRELALERDVEYVGVIIDFHDEVMVECNQDSVQEVEQLIKDSFDIINKKLNGLIPLKCSGGRILNFAEAKISD